MREHIVTLALVPGVCQHSRGAVRHGDRTQEGGSGGGEEVAERGLHDSRIGAETRQRVPLVGQGDEPVCCGIGGELSPGIRVNDLVDPVAPAIERPQDRRLVFACVAPALQLVAGRATHFDQRRRRPRKHLWWQPRPEQPLQRVVGVPRVGRQQLW